MPETKPTVTETPVDRSMDHQVTTVGHPAEAATAWAMAIPMRMPMRPPMRLIEKDSKLEKYPAIRSCLKQQYARLLGGAIFT